jgi:tRNA wybutosine-synthesizing protein 1
MPSALAKLSEEPTQLYISVCAPDEEMFKKACRPQISRGWEELNSTLDNLSNFKCPTVMRITSVRCVNMRNAEGYARLIRKAEPTYVEAKAYMHVGFSRMRLGFENTPSHDEIREFSKQLAHLTDYDLNNEFRESRVVLLSKLKSSRRFDNS